MIIFQKLRMKNFLSYGNTFTDFDFCKSPTALIIGENGAGKSTLQEALCFALFGKSLREINKPQLVNSINEGDCLVELEFSVNSKSYKIRRGIAPVVFEIYVEGVLLNQDAKSLDYQEYLESNILRMNIRTFEQIVVLASRAYVPFMKLTAFQRRAFIEEILGIGIFSTMNSLLKEKSTENKELVASCKSKMVAQNDKIAMQTKHIKMLSEKQSDESKDITEQMTKLESSLLAAATLEFNLSQQLANFWDDKAGESETTKKLGSYTDIKNKFKVSKDRLVKDLTFWDTNNTCPTCKQDITQETKCSHTDKNRAKVAEMEKSLVTIDTSITELTAKLEQFKQYNVEFNDLRFKHDQASVSVKSLKDYIRDLSQKKLVVNSQDIQDAEQILTTFKDELAVIENQLKIAVEERAKIDVTLDLLKDTGVKSKIVKQYMPIINQKIKKYLDAMELFIDFSLNENFVENITTRFKEDFTYGSFSEGQRARIDLALMLVWRDVAKLRNSTATNVIILDEVFDGSLDGSGVDDFLKLINSFGEKTNCIVISHRDAIQDKFQDIIKVTVENKFSKMSRK